MNESDPAKQNTKLENLLVLSASELTKEQKKRRVDLLATILLSLAAVLSALSAYQASRWYSEMNLDFSESSTMRAVAARDDRLMNRQMLADMMLFLKWADNFQLRDTTMMTAIQDRFSPSLKKAFPAWLKIEAKGAAGLLPQGTPFDLPEYVLNLQDESTTILNKSDEKFNAAKLSAQEGDDFIFSLVIFSLALFFGAVCTKIEEHIFQATLLWIGVTILLVGVIIISQLQWNFGF
jgi:hypothetical protein